jgi:hypothetical protein
MHARRTHRVDEAEGVGGGRRPSVTDEQRRRPARYARAARSAIRSSLSTPFPPRRHFAQDRVVVDGGWTADVFARPNAADDGGPEIDASTVTDREVVGDRRSRPDPRAIANDRCRSRRAPQPTVVRQPSRTLCETTALFPMRQLSPTTVSCRNSPGRSSHWRTRLRRRRCGPADVRQLAPWPAGPYRLKPAAPITVPGQTSTRPPSVTLPLITHRRRPRHRRRYGRCASTEAVA